MFEWGGGGGGGKEKEPRVVESQKMRNQKYRERHWMTCGIIFLKLSMILLLLASWVYWKTEVTTTTTASTTPSHNWTTKGADEHQKTFNIGKTGPLSPHLQENFKSFTSQCLKFELSPTFEYCFVIMGYFLWTKQLWKRVELFFLSRSNRSEEGGSKQNVWLFSIFPIFPISIFKNYFDVFRLFSSFPPLS